MLRRGVGRSQREWLLGAGAALLTAVLFTAAFPPFGVAEAAFVFAVPLVLWLFRAPRGKLVAVLVPAAFALSWLVLIVWLRHVTFGGYLLLSIVLGLYFTIWFAAAWKILPRVRDLGFGWRIGAVTALAAFWVVTEWVRSFILTGFPWLPLAASHWERPLMLQMAAWTGAFGVSFVLVFFNLGIAFYIDRLVRFYGQGWKRFCPEFFVALTVMLLAAFGFSKLARDQAGEREAVFHAAFVQPYIEQTLKWEPAKAGRILETIERTTLLSRELPARPDVILWPEAVTPFPVLGRPRMQEWVESVAEAAGVPIFLGGIGIVPGTREENWFNGIYAVDPEDGLLPHYYRKRKLVPYGEYIPLERYLPFLSKIVPLEGSFGPGDSADPIAVRIRGEEVRLGGLVCYEDVFPRLSRDTVARGAEFLVVASNNAWYGEEWMPFQHAAHSVLRAVETRRPVLRVGNGGWSGWIDEYGHVRFIMTDADGSIYFRGSASDEITRDSAWAGSKSFYVRHGEWAVTVCGAFFILFGGTLCWSRRNRGASSDSQARGSSTCPAGSA